MKAGQRAKNGSFARVLIVDDNSDAAQTTGMWLELKGHQVDVLIDGTKCLSQFDSFDPHVLLLDIAMPTVSGYDLAKIIRSQPKFDKLAIIAISGYADAEHARRSLDSGCNQHFAKPVDLNQLNEVIATALQDSG
jgi:two-component system, chemotaxis family, CheB/CheR fusion protein